MEEYRKTLKAKMMIAAEIKGSVNGTVIQGRSELYWDARDAAEARVPSGVYFYRLSTPGGTQTKRLMILK